MTSFGALEPPGFWSSWRASWSCQQQSNNKWSSAIPIPAIILGITNVMTKVTPIIITIGFFNKLDILNPSRSWKVSLTNVWMANLTKKKHITLFWFKLKWISKDMIVESNSEGSNLFFYIHSNLFCELSLWRTLTAGKEYSTHCTSKRYEPWGTWRLRWWREKQYNNRLIQGELPIFSCNCCVSFICISMQDKSDLWCVCREWTRSQFNHLSVYFQSCSKILRVCPQPQIFFHHRLCLLRPFNKTCKYPNEQPIHTITTINNTCFHILHWIQYQ